MIALRWLLMAAGSSMFGSAAGVVAYDVYLAMQFQKLMGSGQPGAAEKAGLPAGPAGPSRPIRWLLAAKHSAGSGRLRSWRCPAWRFACSLRRRGHSFEYRCQSRSAYSSGTASNNTDDAD